MRYAQNDNASRQLENLKNATSTVAKIYYTTRCSYKSVVSYASMKNHQHNINFIPVNTMVTNEDEYMQNDPATLVKTN